MQGLGYIKIHNVKLPVLYRAIKNGKALKLRAMDTAGVFYKDFGNFLEDESEYLKDKPTLVMDLLDGQTINL